MWLSVVQFLSSVLGYEFIHGRFGGICSISFMSCQLQVWHITFKIIYKSLDVSNVWSQNFAVAKWINKTWARAAVCCHYSLLCLQENQDWLAMEGFQSAKILTLCHCVCQMIRCMWRWSPVFSLQFKQCCVWNIPQRHIQRDHFARKNEPEMMY